MKNNSVDNKFYIYCITKIDVSVALINVNGFNANNFIKVIYQDLCIIGEKVKGHIKDINNGIMIHENVIEDVMKNNDVLPMRFNSIVKDEIAAEKILSDNYLPLMDSLKNVSGKAEYGIKAIWNYKKIYDKVLSKLANEENTKIKGNSPAKEYLKKKFANYRIHDLIEREADIYINKINKFFVNTEYEKIVKKLQTEKLFYNASFLIKKNDENKFKEDCFKLKKALENEFKFLFSGPWPPYNFVKNIKV